MNTIGTVPVDGWTVPLALKVIVSRLLNCKSIVSMVDGRGANAPDGSEYVSAAEVVSTNTC
jgi:hypothetical protein